MIEAIREMVETTFLIGERQAHILRIFNWWNSANGMEKFKLLGVERQMQILGLMKSCHWGEKISELLNGETGPQIEILQLMISNSEGREDVELVWDDWGHERDVRDHTGDGWDHVEDVVVVGESTKSDKLTESDSWTDDVLPVGWRNPIFQVESYRFTKADSWK